MLEARGFSCVRFTIVDGLMIKNEKEVVTLVNSKPIIINNSNQVQLTEEQMNGINDLIEKSKSENTIRAYNSDWEHFKSFCNIYKFNPLPASLETVAAYIYELAEKQKHKLSTIKRKLTSINKAHVLANLPSSTNVQMIKEMLDGVAREKGSRKISKKAIILDDLKQLIDNINTTTITGKRDKALILLGFITASRRSELVSINVDDITFTNQGMDVDIYQSKTKEYKTITIEFKDTKYCCVSATKEWLEASEIKSNALLRSITKSNKIGERLTDKSVSNIVKKYAELAGLNPELYSGHSLRSGFATSAKMANFSESSIMEVTGHTSRSTLQIYMQAGDKKVNNPTNILGNIIED